MADAVVAEDVQAREPAWLFELFAADGAGAVGADCDPAAGGCSEDVVEDLAWTWEDGLVGRCSGHVALYDGLLLAGGRLVHGGLAVAKQGIGE